MNFNSIGSVFIHTYSILIDVGEFVIRKPLYEIYLLPQFIGVDLELLVPNHKLDNYRARLPGE